MKRFKVHVNIDEPHDINKDNYEKYVKHDPHYEKKTAKGKRYYAVCPACDNPIQIIGMYQPLKDKRQNIGVHEKKDLPYIAVYDEVAYRMCPYKSDAKKSITKILLNQPGELNISIYNTVHDHFDKVIYMVKQILRMHISHALAKVLLDGYIASDGFMYSWATLYNIPWMLLYMNQPISMSKRVLLPDSPLYGFFSNEEGVSLEEVCKKNGDLYGYKIVHGWEKEYRMDFWRHHRDIIDDEVIETLRVRICRREEVAEKTDVIDEWTPVFEYDVEIDEVRFLHLLCSKKAEIYKSQGLLDLADEMMPELGLE